MSVLKKRAEPKFHREQAAVRREALIESTLRCLKRHGHDGVSVRRISSEAAIGLSALLDGLCAGALRNLRKT
ncbi:MAG: hypothetical protein U1F35_00990 [Steroidobacteraceae bacterium]